MLLPFVDTTHDSASMMKPCLSRAPGIGMPALRQPACLS
jgi:hypothetical protein